MRLKEFLNTALLITFFLTIIPNREMPSLLFRLNSNKYLFLNGISFKTTLNYSDFLIRKFEENVLLDFLNSKLRPTFGSSGSNNC